MLLNTQPDLDAEWLCDVQGEKGQNAAPIWQDVLRI